MRVRSVGSCADSTGPATALLDHQPVGGWPKAADVAVSDNFAIQALMNAVLGLDVTTELDSAVLMSALGRGPVAVDGLRPTQVSGGT